MKIATSKDLSTSLPPPWLGKITACLHKACEVLRRRVVFLDDDPIGTQAVSDIAVRALTMRHALVLRQLLLGVPVWRSDKEARSPGMPYVVFPGNGGETDASLHAHLTCACAHVQA